MSPQAEIAIATVRALTPFLPLLAGGGLPWLSRRIGQRRMAGIARQIALTDAIYWELDAVAVPVARQAWLGGWSISMVPFKCDGTVGAPVRIAHQLFLRREAGDASEFRIVLTPQERRPAGRAAAPPTPPPDDPRAQSRLGGTLWT